MMFQRKFLTAVAAVAALALSVSACGGGSSGGATTSGGGSGSNSTLTLGLIAQASTFSAQDMAFANESPYGQAVYDTLLKADPDGKVLPSLATEWSYNDDKTVLSMTVRSDVTFSDGTKFNADAAAQNLIRFRDGASPNKGFLVNVKDARATDETHLEITLTVADPGLLNFLTQNAGMVEAPSAFAKPDIKTNPVGSGPYLLDNADTVAGSTYVFTKNPNYWDKASQHYEKLVLKVFSDPTAMLNAIKGNQLNGAKLSNNDALDQITATGFTLNPFELDWSGMVLMDRAGTLNPALGNVKVRQAINYAFDSNALLRVIGKGHGTQTSQVFPTSSVAYDSALDSRYAYDPAKAKTLLAEAGYPNGFTLDMPSTGAVGTAIWPLIQQQLKDVGITVNYTEAGSNFVSDLLAAKYAASWFQLAEVSDWETINVILSATATFNPFKYDDPEFDKLVATAHDASNDTETAAAMKAINNYVVEQAWFAPWYRIQSNYATDAHTSVKTQVGNAYPYLWNFIPKF
jgi:peptide/nickel transport system substrate-binding protein